MLLRKASLPGRASGNRFFPRTPCGGARKWHDGTGSISICSLLSCIVAMPVYSRPGGCSARMLSLLLVVVVSPAFALSSAVGQSCKMPSGAEGICQLATDCSSATESLQKNYTRPITCGFQGHQPIICCDGRTDNSVSGTNTPTAITLRGKKSEEACHQYASMMPVAVSKRVLGGELVDQGEMPHMAALGFTSTKGDNVMWQCSGSLISDRYVLTAAHCVIRRETRLEKVRLGGVDLSSSSEGAEEVSVDQIIVHPDFIYRSPYNDIALVRLARDIKFSENLFPACLYTRPQVSGNMLVVAGWGAVDPLGEEQSPQLLMAVLQTMELSKCNETFGNNPRLSRGVVDTMICAYDPQGMRDTCRGDAGGPLQTQTQEVTNIYSIVGITSFGHSLCGFRVPAIYTKVYSYLPWIESIVWP